MKCCENVEHEISGVLALLCDSVSCHFIPGHGLTMATGPHPGARESWAMIYSSHCKLLTAGPEHWTLDCPLRMWHCITQDDFSDEYTTVHCWTSHPPGIMHSCPVSDPSHALSLTAVLRRCDERDYIMLWSGCMFHSPRCENFMRSDGVSPRVGGNARPVCLNSFGIGHGYFHLLCNHKITFFFLSSCIIWWGFPRMRTSLTKILWGRK